jgi:hypothetical protein
LWRKFRQFHQTETDPLVVEIAEVLVMYDLSHHPCQTEMHQVNGKEGQAVVAVNVR